MRDRIFYTGMSLLAAATVLLGFSPTFYLRSSTMPPLETLLVIHGIVFSSWIALFVTQTSLIAANRRDIHRKLGVLGACIAALMVVVMAMAAVNSMRLGHAPVAGLDPRSFFAIPARDMVVFTLLVGAALWFRREPETHKRLMILGAFAYDFATRRSIHRAYKWGAALIILSQPLCLAISGTRPWLSFADWLLR